MRVNLWLFSLTVVIVMVIMLWFFAQLVIVMRIILHLVSFFDGLCKGGSYVVCFLRWWSL